MKKGAVPTILVAVVLLALGGIAEAQQPKKVLRIGYLESSRGGAPVLLFRSVSKSNKVGHLRRPRVDNAD
jgi:hypothetical protein